MDKLDTTLLGGFPFELDDLRWAFTGIDRAFKGIADGIGNCILAGCEVSLVSGSTYNITGGFILWNGEVREFIAMPGAELPGGPAVYALQPEDDLDPSGVETFEDLTTQNAYLRQRARLFYSVPGLGINLATGPRLGDRLRELVTFNATEPWRLVADSGSPDEPALTPVFSQGSGETGVMYRKDADGIVWLRGNLDGTLATGAITDFTLPSLVSAFTLPVGYRPPSGRVIFCRLLKPTSYTLLLNPVMVESRVAYISPNGTFYIIFETANDANDIFSLGEFPAFAATS